MGNAACQAYKHRLQYDHLVGKDHSRSASNLVHCFLESTLSYTLGSELQDYMLTLMEDVIMGTTYMGTEAMWVACSGVLTDALAGTGLTAMNVTRE